MARKRANPFLEDYLQQSKVHVGLKQFNNNMERMKTVHVKTLELLFKGAKKPMSFCEGTVEPPAPSMLPARDTRKQLIISKDGKLEHSDKMGIISPVLVGKCKCEKLVEGKCSYCETEWCASCLHTCCQCCCLYCTQCLLIGFDDREVCISCCR